MLGMVELLFGWLASLLKSRRRLRAENLVLRHQLNILRGRAPGRTRLGYLSDWNNLCPGETDRLANGCAVAHHMPDLNEHLIFKAFRIWQTCDCAKVSVCHRASDCQRDTQHATRS